MAIRAIAGVVTGLIVCILAIEARHHSMHRHWFGYGAHVDVLSDRSDYPGLERESVQYLAVTNFGILSISVKACIPNDPRGHQIPIAPSHVETQEKTGWATVQSVWTAWCSGGRKVNRTVWPLMSFYTRPIFINHLGRSGELVRIVATSSAEGTGPREFASGAIRIPKDVPMHCPQECIAIQSMRFCEPAAGDCRDLKEWRDRPSSPHPDTVDVVLELYNGASDQYASDELLILCTLHTIIAPTNQYGLEDLQEIRTSLSWGMQEDVKMTVVKPLAAGETRRVRIAGFNVQKLVKLYGGEDDSLWPWWLRVNLRIEEMKGENVAKASTELPLIPSDTRLAGPKHRAMECGEPIKPIVIAPKPRRFW